MKDLREFLSALEARKDIKTVLNADPNLEMGYLTELQSSRPEQPALLFDEILNFPKGFRVLVNALNTEARFALAHGLPLELKGMQLVKAWKERLNQKFQPLPPIYIQKGTVEENILLGSDIDLNKFPIPKWNSEDGGRYIGTGDVVILKDKDTGWVNLGTYRVQAQDKDSVSIHIVDGHHGDRIRKSYWDKGENCPVAVICGQDPLLYSLASNSLCPAGISDYDFAGWLQQYPVEVIKGKTVDLPIPAHAEIVLEGEMLPPGSETRIEGPFGEWEGYFAGSAKPEPIVKIKCIMHRNQPILMGAPPIVAAYDLSDCRNLSQAAGMWKELEDRLPGISGVFCPNEMRGLIMTVVSMKQLYPGHVKQVAMAVAGSAMSSLNRYIIIVDDDIDPSNMSEVLWAMATRSDPAESIDIIDGFCGMRSDPRLSPEKKEKGELYYSKAIIDACRPYTWMHRYPKTIKSDPGTLQEVMKKWGSILF